MQSLGSLLRAGACNHDSLPDTMVNIAHLAASNFASSGTIQVSTSSRVEAHRPAASLPCLTLKRLLGLNEKAYSRSSKMKTRFIVGGAIAAALLASTAMAQTPTTATKPEVSSAGVAQSYKGQWRAYKMVGLDVYNQNNEKLGDISELEVGQACSFNSRPPRSSNCVPATGVSGGTSTLFAASAAPIERSRAAA